MIAMRSCRQRGFTLIEMMIALVILALLVLLAAPMYGEMLANTEVRNASENILMGLRDAQSRAIQSNAPARLVLDTTSGSGGWSVYQYMHTDDAQDGTEQLVRSYTFKEGASRATVAATGGTQVTFNGLGQIIGNADGSATMSQVDITTSAISSPRVLRILVGTKDVAAGMKMCDPSYSTSDPVGCPTL